MRHDAAASLRIYINRDEARDARDLHAYLLIES